MRPYDGAMVSADDGLRSALDRLSTTLERIHHLLGELYSVQREGEPGEAAQHDVAHSSSEANSTETEG